MIALLAIGTTPAEGADATPVLTFVRAATVKVYEVPAVRPVMTVDVPVGVRPEHDEQLGLATTT